MPIPRSYTVGWKAGCADDRVCVCVCRDYYHLKPGDLCTFTMGWTVELHDVYPSTIVQQHARRKVLQQLGFASKK